MDNGCVNVGAGPIVSLYISYWSLQDPLCQTQSLAYLRKLTRRGHRFVLITFEQPQYALGPHQAASMKSELARQGIHWYPLRYHKKYSLLATAFDCLCGVAAGLYLTLRYRARIVHSRASIPAAMALVVARLRGLKFLYDADSVLSEEYVDSGHWTRGSRAFKMTAWFERLARKSSDAIIVLSEQLRQDFLRQFRVRAPVTVIPCCVDVEKFRFDPHARARRRAELGLGDEPLFVYVGKVGSWYLVDETFEFFKAARAQSPGARLLVLTGDAPEAFHEVAARRGVSRAHYDVRHAPHAEVAGWLAAADAGLALILSAPSKRGSSPVKVGEYLAVGLPVVMTPGIGDYSALVERERLGVVIETLVPDAYRESAERLSTLLAEGDALRRRCRAAAVENFSLDEVGATRYQSVYEQLL